MIWMFLLVSCADTGDQKLTPSELGLPVSPSAVSFSSVEIGEEGTQEVTLSSRGDADIALLGVTFSEETLVYLADYLAWKEDPADGVVHAIGGPSPQGCPDALPFEGVYEATVETGGVFLDFCDEDWGAYMETLALASLDGNMRTFSLSRDSGARDQRPGMTPARWPGLQPAGRRPSVYTPSPARCDLGQLDPSGGVTGHAHRYEPLEASIEVSLDGERLEAGWSYNAALNAVVFDREVAPDVGSQVTMPPPAGDV